MVREFFSLFDKKVSRQFCVSLATSMKLSRHFHEAVSPLLCVSRVSARQSAETKWHEATVVESSFYEEPKKREEADAKHARRQEYVLAV